ncbi:oxygen-independent coproporphyrinogen III oxidase [Pleionea sediminis]|uniref:oxygen-independent coproporphyrinogen III oxidase n=1 Tax=Pleionea sediminis TaxID=2569479 RepID=UPI0011856037|nr:oxygen-independent coproporphyrinogen III oxidase [Pleionea sediminis]
MTLSNQPVTRWDSQLVQRYNVSGPRYTSYPTALEFNESLSSSHYLQALGELSANAPLSLYIHIPFCWHVCYYCACNKVITRDYSRVEPYLNALEKEMAMVARSLKGQVVQQIHWGGGTPTFLNSNDRARLVTMLRHYFNIAPADQLEFSLEVDPRTVSVDEIAELRTLGFNRLSLGIQDFDHKVQKAVFREQSYSSTKALVDAARKENFQSISFDLIYGLPFQTTNSFERTLQQVIDLKPDRLSVFNYAHLPHRFKPQRKINEQDLPSVEEKLAILELTINRMQQAGYVYIGMDHFALPEDELAVAQRNGKLHRNFQGYTTGKECELIGFGVSAISSFNQCYFQNERTVANYYEALEHGHLPVWRGIKMSSDDVIRKAVIFEMICNFELDIKNVESKFNISFWEYFSDSLREIRKMKRDDLIHCESHRIQVTDKGRMFIRNICMAFDAFLGKQPEVIAYSKAV